MTPRPVVTTRHPKTKELLRCELCNDVIDMFPDQVDDFVAGRVPPRCSDCRDDSRIRAYRPLDDGNEARIRLHERRLAEDAWIAAEAARWANHPAAPKER